jgi:hypothetical protein
MKKSFNSALTKITDFFLNISLLISFNLFSCNHFLFRCFMFLISGNKPNAWLADPELEKETQNMYQ